MNESQFADILREALDEFLPDVPEFSEVIGLQQAGLLTNDAGMIVRFADGNEFKLTIKQSEVMAETEFEPSLLSTSPVYD